MNNTANTIEDLLEILAGLSGQGKMQVDSSDTTIMHSVARQTFKGTALTDRQYALMKEKIVKYKDQFTALDYDFDRAIENLRLPLRYIDRSRYIKLVDYPDDDIIYNSDVFNGQFIKIRFPFKKSDIVLINEISNSNTYLHQKGSHSHFFHFNESNVIKLLDRFINKEFEIDKEIKEVYAKAKSIQENKTEYLSGLQDLKLVNINPVLSNIIQEEIGEVDDENIIKLIDRKFRYGFNLYNTKEPSNLKEKIVYRKEVNVLCKPSEHSMNELMSTIWDLDRFPMVVLLDKNRCEDQLYELANYFRDIMPSECQSVLFRVDDASAGFNQLVKDRKLNNWVDNYTKIVYISVDKLPKVLLKADWSPITAFSFNSRHDRAVEQYINNRCDLVVYREEEMSPFRRYSRLYG